MLIRTKMLVMVLEAEVNMTEVFTTATKKRKLE